MRWLWVACVLGGCGGGCGRPQMVMPGVDSAAGPRDSAPEGSTASRPVCGGSVTSEATCSGVDQLVLSDPQVKNLEGGPISPGQAGTIEIVVTNGSTQAVGYPCIGFATDDARVTLTGSNPVFTGTFSIAPSVRLTARLDAQWGASIPSGTVVHLTAWTDVLHGGCTQGAELRWDVTVR